MVVYLPARIISALAVSPTSTFLERYCVALLFFLIKVSSLNSEFFMSMRVSLGTNEILLNKKLNTNGYENESEAYKQKNSQKPKNISLILCIIIYSI